MKNGLSQIRFLRVLEGSIISMMIFYIVFFSAPDAYISIQQAKLKRTNSDMRNLGSVWLSWHTDQVGAQSAGQTKMFRVSDHELKTYEEMVEMLVPNYYPEELPRIDGWRNEYVFSLNRDLASSPVLAVYSPGRCGKFEIEPGGGEYPIAAYSFETNPSHDIIWSDGYFVSWPETRCYQGMPKFSEFPISCSDE